MATVHLPRLLDPTTGGRRTLQVAGSDVGTAIASLMEALPGVEGHLFDHSGALRPHVLCFVDGEATRLENRSAAVSERTEIRFVQAVSGG
ncbi:MAG TPA: MoaD/ThiS family protein [Acidimicrobiia bacterium]|nr:MoaD/ThiS family protein [Acidimicrobiia bacterium]